MRVQRFVGKWPMLALSPIFWLACDPKKPAEKIEPAPSASRSPAASALPSKAPEPSTSVTAGPPPESELAKDSRCKTFENLSLPSGDQPTAAERKALSSCDAEALYYGVGARPDFLVARKCAYAQYAAGKDSVFEGAGMLKMIYANGRGVPTNFDLAIKFACESHAAPFELGSEIDALLEARRGSGLKEVFDLCDFATSGYRSGFCARRDERLAEVERDARKAKAIAGLPGKEVAALELAARAFIETRTRNEVDLGGTMRAALQIEEEARLSDEYVEMLEKLRDPAFEPSAPSGTETELEASYHRLVGCKELGSEFVVYRGFSRKGFQTTQKQWRLYRDAWLALVKKVRPQSALAWKGWLTDQRLRTLDGIPLCEKR